MPRKKGERKYETMRKGRAYWRPGEEHPMDALFEELDKLREQLPAHLEQLQIALEQTSTLLQPILSATKNLDDPVAIFTPADHIAHRAIVQRFHNRKHYAHLKAAFTIQRYRRLVGRLQAIEAALALANGLLKEEQSFSPELLDQAQETEGASIEIERPVTRPGPETTEELRLQGLDEPLDAIAGSTERTRQLLRDFEASLPKLREQLLAGQGWFEVFYVPKRRYKPEVVAYSIALEKAQERQTSVAAEIEKAVHPEVRALIRAGIYKFPSELRDEVYNIVEVGPYVKYRWREAGQVYTISLGLEDDYPPFPFVPEGF